MNVTIHIEVNEADPQCLRELLSAAAALIGSGMFGTMNVSAVEAKPERTTFKPKGAEEHGK